MTMSMAAARRSRRGTSVWRRAPRLEARTPTTENTVISPRVQARPPKTPLAVENSEPR
jgi:hypothetical protein